MSIQMMFISPTFNEVSKMKPIKFVSVAVMLFASSNSMGLGFAGKTTVLTCGHPPGNPNRDWTTVFPMEDTQSAFNAIEACVNNGGTPTWVFV